MAQVAAWMKANGARVSGSDEDVYPPMSDFLRAQGIEVFSPYRAENLNSAQIAVIGNALSRGNPEVEAVLEKRLPYVSLPELIRAHILTDRLPIVVAGTHGKTTTTAALTQILKAAGFSPGYLIGGLPVGWDAGFHGGQGRWFAIEGDEYDSAFFDKRPKFLHYQPHVVVLNNIEFDHADIYASIEDIYLQFSRLIQLIPRNGCLVINRDESNLDVLISKALCPVRTFSLKANADVRGELVELSPEGMKFKLHLASGHELLCGTPLWGNHQLSNLIGAAAAAEFAGATPPQIAAGIAQFRGVHRRLELKFSASGRWLYDDFAHHPTAVKAALSSLRARHPGIFLAAAFEPRSNTMVRNFFQSEMPAALSLADRVVLGGIHRRDRIPADQRLDVSRIVADLRAERKEAHCCNDADKAVGLLLRDLPPQAVIVLMSNGAFSGLCARILERLRLTTAEEISPGT